ncbi:MAG: sulfur oxidation c-type cytochrome SoxA [Alphaproteobacteria bacterium]|nr:MAG: sulfur oxidation c-type cytochrome SoxA [Alphaproteobacteria bacterium]
MRRKAFATAALVALGLAGPLSADPVDDKLIVNGETELVTHTKAPDYIDGLDEIWSGWAFRAAETRAIEADDFDNPGMIFVEDAEAVWNRVEGGAGKSCASCHGDPSSMKGVRTVMPKYNEKAGDLWSLEDYINDCRVNRMQAEAWGWNDKDMVNMTALISVQSRGMPMNVAIDGPAKPYWEKGREMYYTRTGQLELSCANCHEDHYGDMIRADHLSQGQINGFPTYRLKNAKLNSIHARFKGCVRDTRAATYKPGSPEFHALELYVASRGNGLSVEGVAVRN